MKKVILSIATVCLAFASSKLHAAKTYADFTAVSSITGSHYSIGYIGTTETRYLFSDQLTYFNANLSIDWARITSGKPTTLAGYGITDGLTAATAASTYQPIITTGSIGPTQLASTAVTAGSYTLASITVDADGRITAASNGTAGAGDLLSSNNLSDLASASTARTNLGIGNVNNTSDANKPISTATQTALDLKAPIANPTFTGTVTIPTLTATILNFTTWGTGTVPDANIASTLARDSEVTAAVAAEASARDTAIAAAAISTQTGMLATPSTTTPLSPTWTGGTHVVFVGGTQTINLPAASGYSGRALMLVFRGSYVATVDPNASEIIYRDGTAQTGGVSCTVTGTLNQQAIFYSDGTSWVTVGTSATLAAGS